ncbi:MAG: S8 family serine peptidase [Acholeplasmataceae bacterium]|nr:S8 family serine peptidase [Acholeplasmataceae bacterium]
MAKKTSKNTSLIIISMFTLILIILLLFTIYRTTGFADEIFKSKTDSKLLDSKATGDLEKLDSNPEEIKGADSAEIETTKIEEKEEIPEIKAPAIIDNKEISVSIAQKENYLAKLPYIKIIDNDTITSIENNTKMNAFKLKKPEKYYDGYIIKLKEMPILVKKKELKEQRLENSVVSKQLEEYKIELKLKKDSIKGEISEKINKDTEKIITKEFTGNIISGFVLNISDADAEKLKNINGIEVYPNYFVQANLYDSVNIIRASDVWHCMPVNPKNGEIAVPINQPGPCLTGNGVKIAIIDTGVDYTHPDLGGCLGSNCKIIGGYDFINNDADPIDDMGHGTHCASVAAGNGILKGVAPDAKILAYKVLDQSGSGYTDDIISGIEQAVIDGADIISISLGGPGDPDDPKSIAVDTAIDLGVTVVVAAANNGPGENTIRSPGNARKAITVGATDKQDNIANFSSRGPVIWNNGENILIKPDIVAPGVSICAAQFDSWLDEYSCLNDGEHIAIDGTSMATPHVAGAAALLKQKDSSLNPEEIKQILKNSTEDLGFDITTQGFGRLNVLSAVKLNDVPIAKLNMENYNLSGIVSIIGTVKDNNLDRYEVYYKSQENSTPDNWILICQGNQEVNNGILCNRFDTFNLDDKEIKIKLIVFNLDNNISSRDISVNNINNFEITDFGTNGYLKRKESITGQINSPNYTAYKIEYHSSSGNLRWTPLCSGQGTLTGGNICNYNFNNFEDGKYVFRFSILKNNVWLSDNEIERGVINELLDGWPVSTLSVPYSELLSANINGDSKIISNNSKYTQCSIGGCFSWNSKLYIFGNNANSDVIDNVTINENNSDFLNPFKPAIKDEKMAINIGIVNSDGYYDFGNNYYGGIIDLEGNFYENWPLPNDTYTFASTSPMILGNNLFFGRDGYSDSYLFGFNIDGTPLSGYPIIIDDNLSNTSEIINIKKIGEIKSNGQENIGVLYDAHFSSDAEGNYNDRLFFNIYSESGQLISRTLMSETENETIKLSDFVSADFDGDGSTEIVIAISHYYWSGANRICESFIKILDSNGNIIFEPFATQGGLINNYISIADFNGSPHIIFDLSDDIPLLTQNHKIKIIDYHGNEFLEISPNEIIGSVSVGNVITDNIVGSATNRDRKQIIVGYQGRYYGESPGILIYNSNGELLKEIVIPVIIPAAEYIMSNQGDYPILNDFDGDGNVNIIFQTTKVLEVAQESRIFVFDLKTKYNPNTIDWTQFAYDGQNTNCYKCNN